MPIDFCRAVDATLGGNMNVSDIEVSDIEVDLQSVATRALQIYQIEIAQKRNEIARKKNEIVQLEEKVRNLGKISQSKKRLAVISRNNRTSRSRNRNSGWDVRNGVALALKEMLKTPDLTLPATKLSIIARKPASTRGDWKEWFGRYLGVSVEQRGTRPNTYYTIVDKRQVDEFLNPST